MLVCLKDLRKNHSLSQDMNVFLTPFIARRYPLGTITYNVSFLPLLQIPGAAFWGATRLTFVSSILGDNLAQGAQGIHEQYGKIVGVAPNEMSFVRSEA